MNKPAVEWQIDVLLGLVQSLQVAIGALMRDHPEKDRLEAYFDMLLAEAKTQLLNSDRSDLAVAALEDNAAALKQNLTNMQTADMTAFLTWHRLEKRFRSK